MDDHSSSPVKGPWSGGWLIAAIAGIIAALLALWLGAVGMAPALLIGLVAFIVFAVLLGTGGVEVTWLEGHGHGDHGHGHDDHGHGDHAKSDHERGHEAVHEAPHEALVAAKAADAPVAIASPVAAPVYLAAAPAAPTTASAEGTKPAALSGPRGGKGDDLKTIEGIGPALERLCHELGIFHFDQIAAWGPAEVAWMDGNLKGFKGRVTRDKWVAQAKIIVTEGIPAFLIRAKTNNY